ncbi:MAG: MarR family winged helix-turn-helix transcriptional regulator [Flavicella sp.]
MEVKNQLKRRTALNIHSKTISNILIASNWVNEKNTIFFKNYNLSSQQYTILKTLRSRRGVPASLTEVHERMISRMSNTTRLIDKLILKKLVTKSICEKNKRKIEIILTPSGQKILAAIDLEIDNVALNITKNINLKEHLILNELLDKLIGANKVFSR